ncbi:hypothetical protein [Dyella sp. AD56]|uniref:hypothetical protein n=1 Tax=Dyella sp. AD56 TaxID=1528744 RepID=UPI0011AF4F5B|nr:hypothetical protein [Dyella sp. AD56]
MARISELGPLYNRCTDKGSASRPASLSVTDLNGTVLSVQTDHPFDHQAFARDFCLTDQWSHIGRMFAGECFLLSQGSVLDDHLPHVEGLSDGSAAIVAPYPNGIRLSKLLRLHLLSAFLGTYARYHPEPWIAAVFGHVNGDHIMPLIRAATDLVDAEYPRLVIKELEDRV